MRCSYGWTAQSALADVIQTPGTNAGAGQEPFAGQLFCLGAHALADLAEWARARQDPAEWVRARQDPAEWVRARQDPAEWVRARQDPAEWVRARQDPAEWVRARQDPAEWVRARQDPAAEASVRQYVGGSGLGRFEGSTRPPGQPRRRRRRPHLHCRPGARPFPASAKEAAGHS